MSCTPTKQPLKMLEVPLNKYQEVIPHHQTQFEQYKSHILKIIIEKNGKLALHETKRKKQEVKQLKDLMYELDTLRTQVADHELDKFDTKTLSLRKALLALIAGYSGLDKKAQPIISEYEAVRRELNESGSEPLNAFAGSPPIQMHETMDEFLLKQRAEVLREVEIIQKDTEDLNEMYHALHGLVEQQGTSIELVERCTESTGANVDSGLRHLITAHRLKTTTYPLAGAVIGGIVGGPIGLVAGLKIGGLASVGCALLGYTGGRFFKRKHQVEEVVEPESELSHEQATDTSDLPKKKDI